MGDDITYLDLLILKKIDSESTVEKFGTQINTSFFETANILGSMKIKGLIDIQSSIGGNSPLTITEGGRELISNAIQKAGEPIDTLDQTILSALVAGVRDLSALQKIINIRSRDLAYHLYKLKAYDYVDNEIRSGRAGFSLTEKGFLLTRGYRSAGKAAEVAKPGEKKEEGEGQKEMPGKPGGKEGEGKGEEGGKKKADNEKHASIEGEIKDLFNFAGYKKTDKPKKPAHTPEQPAEQAQNLPWEKPMPGRSKLDKQKMFASKMEYYIQKYALFAIFLLILFGLVIFAIIYVIITS
ncbi:MAG: hypothetical protein ABIH83_01700 [Candidatus Micrarchaeota archaeon]